MSEGTWKILKMLGEIFVAAGSIMLGAEKLLHQIGHAGNGKKEE